MDSASRGGLVGALLGVEKETLASLGSPGREVVILGKRGDLFEIDRLGAEEEELLGVEEVPE